MSKKVYSRFETPETIAIGPFPKEIDIYMEEMDDKGKIKLKKETTSNFYEKIQSYKSETEIYNLLDRFQHGDTQALNRNHNAIYADFTQMPKSIQEAHQMVKKAEKEFNKLPLNIKDEFNNNPTEFLASIQSGTFNQRINKNKNESEELKKEIERLKAEINKAPTTGEILPGQTTLNGGIKYES